VQKLCLKKVGLNRGERKIICPLLLRKDALTFLSVYGAMLKYQKATGMIEF